MKKIALHWQILIGLVFAVITALYIPNVIPFIEWIGIIFIKALKMIVIPLVITSLLAGMLRMGNGANLKRISLKTIIFYLSTSLLAILTGLIAVNYIQPGIGVTVSLPDYNITQHIPPPLSETLLNIVPTNIFESLITGDKAMLSIIFFTILIGYFATKLQGKKRDVFNSFSEACFDIMMSITMFIMRLAPLGIYAIVAVQIAKQDSLMQLAESLGWYALTVILALAFHFFISLPLILKFVGKVNPISHFKNMATPLLTAFSTASSNASLPLTINAVENKNGVSNKISGFTLPLGATINMDGTALYELVVAGFVAQLYGIDLSFGQQFIMVATALLASIGTAAIPMASLATMTIIFTAVNLPLEAIAIILPIDRILDMCRTTTNVWSDTCCATVIAKSENEKLKI